MFTGIIEEIGEIKDIQSREENRVFVIQAVMAPELYIGQSIAHNGACLTVEKIFPEQNLYQVTAVPETLRKTNLGRLKIGDKLNLERAIQPTAHMDGHFVLGHVDAVTHVMEVVRKEKHWYFSFFLPSSYVEYCVPQGSITVNGVSLTIAELKEHFFKVAIVPHTYENTIFQFLKKEELVNLEFDILGKYILRYLCKVKNKQL